MTGYAEKASKIDQWSILLAYSKTRATLLLDPVGGPCRVTLVGDPCKNCLPARIGGWPGTATGGQIHVVHISHTHPPKELIPTLRKYLLGKLLNPSIPKAQERKHFHGKKYFRFVCRDLLMYAFH